MSRKLQRSNQKILPEDVLIKAPSPQFAINKSDFVELDPTPSEQIEHYTGRERRDYLDQQVELLYERVIKELSPFPADVALALKKLNRAQGWVLDEPEQYNAALNELAEVRMMMMEKQMRRQWVYTWGLLVFFYAIIWFVVLAVGLFVDIERLASGVFFIADEYTTIWYVILAGGLGGVVADLYHLSREVDNNRFDRHDVMIYLVQPVTGLILGLLMFFIANTGFLIFGNTTLGTESGNFSSPQLFLIVLAWIAGFRQQDIYRIIDHMVAQVLPKQKFDTIRR